VEERYCDKKSENRYKRNQVNRQDHDQPVGSPTSIPKGYEVNLSRLDPLAQDMIIFRIGVAVILLHAR
jgi:hypothetical protein